MSSVLVRTTALLACALTLAGGCASRHPTRVAVDPWLERLAVADADAHAGCYRCLERALATLEEGLADGRTAIGPTAYRVAVQLAVRERLLGVYPGAHQDAPARLAAHGSPDDVALAIDVVPAIAWRRGTLDTAAGLPLGREDLARLRARRASLEPMADGDAWAATLMLAMIGTNPMIAVDEVQSSPRGPLPRLDRDTWWRRHPDDASLSFTRLVLLRGDVADLARFREMHPGFLETDAILGEAELARGRLVSADEALARALEALPSLVPALALRADLRRRMEDLETALDLYDALLVRLPEHREGLLGRLVCLGFLGRHEEAIATADRMIDLGTWYLGEAHYWKAWNLFTLARLDLARASVDDARRLLVNADVHYLGGVIAFRQQRPDDARRDFDAAIELEGRHCEAHFDRAALALTRRSWPVASDGFDEAFECLAARTPVLEQRVEDARQARLAPEARERLVARRERALRDHRNQMAWARYNGAVGLANQGRGADARRCADEAIAMGGPAAEAAQRLLVTMQAAPDVPRGR